MDGGTGGWAKFQNSDDDHDSDEGVTMLMMMIHDVNDGYNDNSDYGGDKSLG